MAFPCFMHDQATLPPMLLGIELRSYDESKSCRRISQRKELFHNLKKETQWLKINIIIICSCILYTIHFDPIYGINQAHYVTSCLCIKLQVCWEQVMEKKKNLADKTGFSGVKINRAKREWCSQHKSFYRKQSQSRQPRNFCLFLILGLNKSWKLTFMSP